VPDDPTKLDTTRQWDNLELLNGGLLPGENVLVLAEAARGAFKFGLLAATEARLIYVRDRVLRRPAVVAIPYESVTRIEIGEEPASGIIVVHTKQGATRYDTIVPKNRTWLLYWRVQERIADGAQ
jgi:hypothetical protein